MEAWTFTLGQKRSKKQTGQTSLVRRCELSPGHAAVRHGLPSMSRSGRTETKIVGTKWRDRDTWSGTVGPCYEAGSRVELVPQIGFSEKALWYIVERGAHLKPSFLFQNITN